MALEIGTLQVDINADTSGLVIAEKEAKKNMNSINKVMVAAEKEAVNAGRAFSNFGTQASKASKKVGKAANDAGKKVAGFGRNAGQAGIQFQQMVGQLQGGVSPFIAVSQQAADMGIVLGAPLVGVIVSLGAVLAGVLHQALTGSSEAMERATASASDLANEYLKLTKQAEQLEAVKISAAMLEDAGAIAILNKELDKLQKKRSGLTRFREDLAPGLVKDVDKEIIKVDNKLQAFFLLQEQRSERLNKIFNKSFALTADPGEQTEAPIGGGETFNQVVQKEIAVLELRGKLFNDSNAKIEAEIMRFELAALNLFEVGSEDFLAAEQALADKRVELRKDADDKITKQTDQAAKKQQALADAARAMSLSGAAALGNELNQIIEQSGKEGTGIAKALFLANKALAVAQIIMDTQVGAAKAVGQLGVFGIPASALIEATGFARAGIVAGLAVGGSFENGGIVGGSSFSGDRVSARVNSGEMILNRGQQTKLFNMANSGGGGGSSTPNVTIINEIPGATFEVELITSAEVRLIARQESENAMGQINASLASGRGEAAKSLQQGFNMSRNIS